MRTQATRRLAERLGIVSLALVLCACPGMEPILRMHGYMPLKPPSTLFAPGTVVWVKSSRPFAAGVICTQEMSLGPRFKPMVSRTAAGDLSRATDQAMGIAADTWHAIRADTRFSEITDIHLKLDNPVIYELNDVDLLEHVVHRTSACRRAIAMRAKAGYNVTIIASALRADATYTVTWRTDARIGASDKAGVLKSLAVELGAERSTVSDYTIAADDLYWGIKDDKYLAHLSDPELLEPASERDRALGASVDATVSRAIDVPERH